MTTHQPRVAAMPQTDPVRKKYREKALRAARGLAQDRARFGFADDSSGRRYRIGVYFLLAGDLPRAVEAFEQFDIEFPDDVG